MCIFTHFFTHIYLKKKLKTVILTHLSNCPSKKAIGSESDTQSGAGKEIKEALF